MISFHEIDLRDCMREVHVRHVQRVRFRVELAYYDIGTSQLASAVGSRNISFVICMATNFLQKLEGEFIFKDF